MTLQDLSDEEIGPVLLSVARGALLEEFGGEISTEPPADWLEERAASFVTLHLAGELRGCIGTIQAHRSLWQDVRANAKSAAFRDPRFPPLGESELDRVVLDVSLLSPLAPIEFVSETDLLAQIRQHEDGLLIEHGSHRGTFLPAVWHQVASPDEFLRRLKNKAGLESEFWSADLRIFRYTTRSWSELPART